MSISHQQNTPCKKSNGFTLVELLVTIVIVGILASMATSAFDEYKRKANDLVAISDQINLISSFNNYLADVGAISNDPGFTTDSMSIIFNTDGAMSMNPSIPNGQSKILPGYIHSKNVETVLVLLKQNSGFVTNATHCNGSTGRTSDYDSPLTRRFHMSSSLPNRISTFSGFPSDGSGCR